MKLLLCKIREIFRTVRYGGPIDGHDWVNDLDDVHVIITVDYCKTCGEEEISWKRI